jgi:hypothetical protein
MFQLTFFSLGISLILFQHSDPLLLFECQYIHVQYKLKKYLLTTETEGFSLLIINDVTTAKIVKFHNRQCQALQARCMTGACKKSVFFLLSNAHLPSPTSLLMMWHSGQGPQDPAMSKVGALPPGLHGASGNRW